MYWVESFTPLPGGNKAAQARQGKPRQHEPKAQMTYSESGWRLAEAIAGKLGDRVVAWSWGGPAPLLVIPNHAVVAQSSFWRVFGCKGGWLISCSK